jgi:hypothetical protein
MNAEKTELSKCVIVDVDGTLAIRNGRGPFEWRLAKTDVGNSNIIELVKILEKSGMKIVIVTGREEWLRDTTATWLAKHGIQWAQMYMRKDGDFRQDARVKLEFLTNIRDEFEDIFLVLDDRDSVVEMWREQGLTCLQVQEGKH